MRIMAFIMATALAAGTATVADAAAVQTFDNRADFIAATTGLTSIIYDFSDDIADPVYTSGPLTFTAPGGFIFGSGNVITTLYDGGDLLLTFASPIKALGLFGGVGDVDFNYVGGTVSVVANGDTNLSLISGSGAGGYLGFINDAPISQVKLSIASYDVNATSVAFVQLQRQADLATMEGTGLPEPASWAMMVIGFGGVGAALRRTRRPTFKLADGV